MYSDDSHIPEYMSEPTQTIYIKLLFHIPICLFIHSCLWPSCAYDWTHTVRTRSSYSFEPTLSETADFLPAR